MKTSFFVQCLAVDNLLKPEFHNSLIPMLLTRYSQRNECQVNFFAYHCPILKVMLKRPPQVFVAVFEKLKCSIKKSWT